MFKSLRDKLFLRFHSRDEFTSIPLRKYFLERYEISIGLYSYGCFDPARIARGTTIGRYCSFARTASIFNGNHGIGFLSLHPYLYNVALGFVKTETINRTKCVIEDDVWIGHASIILPSVSLIGRGSIIGAGAVVTRNVPRYAVVVGNPGRVIRYRFTEDIVGMIEETKWWEMDSEELGLLINDNPSLVFGPADYYVGKALEK